MKKSAYFIAVILVLVLSGCATVRVGPPETVKVGERTLTLSGLEGFDLSAVTIPDPHAPNVFITANQLIVVDQEPVRPIRFDADGYVTITWALPRGSDYIFPNDNSIMFKAGIDNPLPDRLTCGAVKEKSFVCYYKKPDQSREWKYAIKVKNKRTGVVLRSLDPWVYQD